MPSTVTNVLDGLSTSVAIKAPCRTVALVNLTLSGLQTVNGVAVVEGDRVLVTAQTSPADNGIYMASTGQWQRALDFDGQRDVVQGTRVLIEGTGDGVGYELTTANPIVIGTTALTFVYRAIDSALRVDLANTVAGADGGRLVGYRRTESGAVAQVIRDVLAREVWLDDFGVNATPGTTDMANAFDAARDAVEAAGGGVILLKAANYFFSRQIRQGWYVRVRGMGFDTTTLTFSSSITGNCILWETSGGSYVFGTTLERMSIVVGANAARGLYTQGAHQMSALQSVYFKNVNQVGFEFGSLGGPARLSLPEVWVAGGSTSPITTTLNANKLTGATVMNVAATTGFVAAQRVTLALDSGLFHHTTVASVAAGVSVTLTDAIPSNASIGKVLRISRIGGILNNLSINTVGLLDIEGSTANFDKCLIMQAGHLVMDEFHTENSDKGVCFEQTQSNNPFGNIIGIATSGTTNATLIEVAANFVGGLQVGYAIGGFSPATNNLNNLQNGDSFLNSPVFDYAYTHIEANGLHPIISRHGRQGQIGSAVNFGNRAEVVDFGVNASGRAYGLMVGRDANGGVPLDATAMGFEFDAGGWYNLVLASADGAGVLSNKMRFGKFVNTSLVPIKELEAAVAGLPAASGTYKSSHAFVTDANTTLAAGLGTIVAGGGANYTPVYCDGAAWRIG